MRSAVQLMAVAVAVGALAASLDTASAADRYFPGVCFVDHKGANDLLTGWYRGTLEAMGEPPLVGLPRTITAYRLLWLPSGHSPISVRVVRSGDSAALIVRRLKGPAEWDERARRLVASHQVTYTKRVPLSRRQWEGLERRIKASHYWSMPTKDPRPAPEDGDVLLVEASYGGRYHAVDRHRPGPGYLELCRYMLDLGLDVRGIWQEYHGV
jgi:hypothetical protein